jgi:hypothetical protein
LLSAHTPPPWHLLCLLGGAAPVGGSRGGDTHHTSTSGAGVRGVVRIFLAGEQQPGRSLPKSSNFGFFLRARVCADELLGLTLRLPGPRPCRSGSRLCVRQQRQVEWPLQLPSLYPDATEDLNCAQCRWAGSPGPDSKVWFYLSFLLWSIAWHHGIIIKATRVCMALIRAFMCMPVMHSGFYFLI